MWVRLPPGTQKTPKSAFTDSRRTFCLSKPLFLQNTAHRFSPRHMIIFLPLPHANTNNIRVFNYWTAQRDATYRCAILSTQPRFHLAFSPRLVQDIGFCLPDRSTHRKG